MYRSAALSLAQAARLDACPACDSNWEGHTTRCSDGGPIAFSRVHGVYDDTAEAVAFRCPDCATEFPRDPRELH